MTDPAHAFDTPVRLAVLGTAGNLQALAAEVGVAHITEADLRGALRQTLQAQIGAGPRAEVPMPKTRFWGGRLGATDVAIPDTLACEVKWCRDPNKLGEALWDGLKLGPLTVPESGDRSAYLVYGAEISVWNSPGNRPVTLLHTGDHDIVELLEKYSGFWKQWLPKGPNSPHVLMAYRFLTTSLIATTPIHAPDGADWELRCVRLGVSGPIVDFSPEGWPATSPTVTSAAP